MKPNKILSLFIIIINVFGVICLIYFAIPYFAHNTTIQNPNAMLPMERWDSAGMTLTIGTIPLLVANLLGFLFVKMQRKGIKFFFFTPSIICIIVVAHYWITN